MATLSKLLNASCQVTREQWHRCQRCLARALRCPQSQRKKQTGIDLSPILVISLDYLCRPSCLLTHPILSTHITLLGSLITAATRWSLFLLVLLVVPVRCHKSVPVQTALHRPQTRCHTCLNRLSTAHRMALLIRILLLRLLRCLLQMFMELPKMD